MDVTIVMHHCPSSYTSPSQTTYVSTIILIFLHHHNPTEVGERASVDELNKLLSDEVAFSVFLTSLSQVKVRSSIQLIS